MQEDASKLPREDRTGIGTFVAEVLGAATGDGFGTVAVDEMWRHVGDALKKVKRMRYVSMSKASLRIGRNLRLAVSAPGTIIAEHPKSIVRSWTRTDT